MINERNKKVKCDAKLDNTSGMRNVLNNSFTNLINFYHNSKATHFGSYTVPNFYSYITYYNIKI